MKANIHPDYHNITVVMTDGTKYQTRSCWGKEGDVLQLDVDTKTHPAWVGGVSLRKTGQMEKFNNKFAFLDKTSDAKPANTNTASEASTQAEEPKVEAETKDAKAKKAKKDDKK
jgi:large subunit ribosomal protein L31